MDTLLSSTDPAILDFQLAITLRLKIYDDEKIKDSLTGMNLAVMSANAGQPLEFGDKESRDYPEAP